MFLERGWGGGGVGEQVRYSVRPHTFVLRKAVFSYWREYMCKMYWLTHVYEVPVNRLGGISLLRKSVVRLTDHPDMNLAVYRGRKATSTAQQQQQ